LFSTFFVTVQLCLTTIKHRPTRPSPSHSSRRNWTGIPQHLPLPPRPPPPSALAPTQNHHRSSKLGDHPRVRHDLLVPLASQLVLPPPHPAFAPLNNPTPSCRSRYATTTQQPPRLPPPTLLQINHQQIALHLPPLLPLPLLHPPPPPPPCLLLHRGLALATSSSKQQRSIALSLN